MTPAFDIAREQTVFMFSGWLPVAPDAASVLYKLRITNLTLFHSHRNHLSGTQGTPGGKATISTASMAPSLVLIVS